MAVRLASARMPVFCASSSTMKGIAGNFTRYYGDGRILSEEERAKENVYIQKMEREKIEKQKLKAEKERAEKEMAQKEKYRAGKE
ncbi:hypothetical protein HPP92_009901 [Vanilla planifolia]|uniref:ATPase inhibitor n=1 Tax=Vanilla planifolia TaxID=51239 RepID=A0A835RGN4_VANPL|nr:hypothetical protein HPP92_009901 [Vanilla planifolia]